MQTTTQQIVVRVSAQEKAYWENIAQRNNTTLSALTRDALKAFSKTIYTPTKKNHLLKLADIGESKKTTQKPKNLSVEYKDYLYKDTK